MNKREIMLENYENPFHRELKNDNTYKRIKINNPLCIDEIELFVKANNNLIEDISFDGEACMIVIASTSVLLKNLIGKTIEEAKLILENYEKMINRKPYNKDILGDLVVFEDIYLQPNRIECALLSTNGLKKII